MISLYLLFQYFCNQLTEIAKDCKVLLVRYFVLHLFFVISDIFTGLAPFLPVIAYGVASFAYTEL